MTNYTTQVQARYRAECKTSRKLRKHKATSWVLIQSSMSALAIMHSLRSTGGRPNQIQAIRNAVTVWDRRAWRAAEGKDPAARAASVNRNTTPINVSGSNG